MRGLTVEFLSKTGGFAAVNGVDFTIAAGETLALVGESGSGKSVTSLSIMGLLDRKKIRMTGQILFERRDGSVSDLTSLDPAALGKVRGGDVSMIFQEPMTSLNPVKTAGAQIAEVIRLHQGLGDAAAKAQAVQMLQQVEIADAPRRARAYPHEMSGGMRQRVLIAMALACTPRLLIADEPTTALDVTVQLQILTLLKTVQKELGMGLLFITHNLGVVAEIADRVAVMYGGRIVETAPAETLFSRPGHPYTRGLLDSLPQNASWSNGRPRLKAIAGAVVDPRRPPPGCAFEPRCALAAPDCRQAPPPLAALTPDHASRCLHWSAL